MICIKCGNELKETAKFCMKCGTKVEKQSEAFQRVDIRIDPNIDKEMLYKRAFMYIEDGRKNEAYTYLEWLLDHDPEDARAYLGKLLLDLNVEFEEDIAQLDTDITSNKNYRRAYKYGDDDMRRRLDEYRERVDRNISLKEYTTKGLYELYAVKTSDLYKDNKAFFDRLIRKKEKEAEDKYNRAKSHISDMNNASERYIAEKLFNELGNYKDSRLILEELRNADQYAEAVNYKNQAAKGINTIDNLNKALKIFAKLGDYKEAEKYLNVCKKMMSNLK